MTAAPAPGRRNRLARETSPYLLQHASNPVDWYPWGAEAFEKARAEDKPIFLSIGYSTCHWCHVMERESFENEKVAEYLNTHFVSVKVDREERPEVDEIYMTALTRVFGRGGGWPLSMWLTPELKPFFGGTYFPPEDKGGQPGFLTLLARIQEAWTDQRETLRRDSNEVAQALASISQSTSPGEPRAEAFVEAFEKVNERFDPVFGGLGQAPKFPQPSLIQYLLRAHDRMASAGADSSEPLRLALLQLRNMARGGIYDQLGGGFARYSTDERWLVPHFEKMLYDNAQLLRVYAEAYQLTRDPLFESVIRETVSYALRDLTHADGGFFSAEDADSEGVEGKFYVWRKDELAAILGEGSPDLDLFCRAYDVTDHGNWVDPHHDTAGLNILNLRLSTEDLAEETGLHVIEIAERLEKARRVLLQARGRRVRPGRDDKILTGWNGLMIAGLSKAARALGEPEYVATAARAAEFVLSRLRRKPATGATIQETPRPSLARSWKDADLRGEAGLEDYAYLVDGLLELYQASHDARWLLDARDLHEEALSHFYDPVDGGFWSSAPGREDLISRQKSVDDGALPSPAGVMTLNSLRLGQLFEREDWIEVTEETLKTYAGMLHKHPVGVTTLLMALDWLGDGGRQVVLAGDPGSAERKAMCETLDRAFLPRTLTLTSDPHAKLDIVPLAAGKLAVDGKPAAYVCENRTCRAPVATAADLARALGL